MLSSDITTTTTPARTLSLVSQRPTSSLRSDANALLEEPFNMVVSHETNVKTGKVSSLVSFDSSKPGSPDTDGNVAVDIIKVQLKLVYNPTVGRTGVEDSVLHLYDLLADFMAQTDVKNKLLNKES